MTTYVPLFQEELKSDPFWMLVACSLVNLTHWRQAEPVFRRLRTNCNGKVSRLIEYDLESLSQLLEPLGLQNRRAQLLKKMAIEWTLMLERKLDEYDKEVTRADIEKLPGCGRYAGDTWAIFIENDLTVQPKDGRLNEYLDHVKDR